jgi:hypothetical protein
MAANPILPSELRELCDQLLIPLSAWTAKTIYRMDDAVLETWNNNRPAAKARPDEQTEVPINDRKGLGAFLRGFVARKNAQIERRAKHG